MTAAALESYLDLLLARARHGRKLNALAYCAYKDIEKINAIESDRLLPRATRKRLIRESEASLGACVLLAAKHGKARDIADASKRWPRRSNQEKVLVAYRAVLKCEGRPSVVGELLTQLGIKKPKRSASADEWEKLSNRETVVRKMLRKFGLPLSPGQRGRPRSNFRPARQKIV
jgi:hypothetical protein